MIADFEWPIPPHFYLATDAAGPEPAVLALTDGRRETGTMLGLDPEHGLVEFASQKSLPATQIGFGAFESLRLTRPIALQRLELDPDRQLDPADVSLRQRCVVTFKDGDSLMSETIGYVEHKFGLKKQEALRSRRLGDYLRKQHIVTQAQVERQIRVLTV